MHHKSKLWWAGLGAEEEGGFGMHCTSALLKLLGLKTYSAGYRDKWGAPVMGKISLYHAAGRFFELEGRLWAGWVFGMGYLFGCLTWGICLF